EQFVVRERLTARKSLDRVVAAGVIQKGRYIESLLVVHPALPVGNGHDARTGFGQQIRGDRAYVAEALDADGGALDVEAGVTGRFAGGNHHAASGRLPAAQ